MIKELVIGISFTIVFFTGEIAAFFIFRAVKKQLYPSDKHRWRSVLKGCFERFVLLLGMISGIESADAFYYSIFFTALSFFLVGLIKGKIVEKSIWKSGLITLLIGGTRSEEHTSELQSH